jgi:(1->4)-alpha-D-glucan 1-alpha-D-glucosylmutase
MTLPRSTYRLQLQAQFDFDAAAQIAEYLRDLGVSHIYCSPILQAAPGSTHGYDVVDCHRVNQELGGEPGRQRFLSKLRQCGLGQVLDIVPNHMAITGSSNSWWWDTLENGTFSRYAPYFDIEWNAPEERLRNKILLPVLEDHSGRVIEAGKLTLERREGSFILRYYDHTFPVAPESVAELLESAAGSCGSSELSFLADALAHLRETIAETNWAGLNAHHRNKETIRRLLARLCSEQPEVAAAIDAGVAALNADFDRLDDLLMRQNYRLSRWRASAADMAYRRFFDINSLVGVRVEDELVFADTHALILNWLRSGELDGVRVDHPDGLRDPAQYFSRLRSAAPDAWIVAEKILQPEESLPENWAISGTTGYDFLNLAGGLFIDRHGEAPLNELYRQFTGEPVDFEAVVYEKKSQVLREILGGDVNRLTGLLVQICEEHRDYRDYTRHELHEAIRTVIACFPVYRTYVRAEAGEVSQSDSQTISRAVDAARAARADLDERLFEFLRDILTLRVRGTVEHEFVMVFQQLTAAAMAKGMEDTAFYSYFRLVSLNEVGGNPGRFGVSIEEFHKWCSETQIQHPFTMLSTSTHDTKRGEDVRTRISTLSEMVPAWADAVARWSTANARYRTGEMPDRKTEYLLYQTLVGAWPISVERIVSYMRKAAREGKERTSWVEPNLAYEEALEKFVTSVTGDAAFVADLEAFLALLLPSARASSVALALLKLTSPGVPDLYQGSELWDLTLVDPDNRRLVDFDLRRRLLSEVDQLSAEQIMARMGEGLPKLWTIGQALRTRAAYPKCFGAEGEYSALWATGPKAGYLVAFRRGEDVIAVAPRLVIGAGNWEESSLELPQGNWKNQFTGEIVEGKIDLGALLSRFPVALLTRIALLTRAPSA